MHGTRNADALLGGGLGGLLGTSAMVLVGLGVEAGAGLPTVRLLPELELAFGGPVAGAGALGATFALPVHYAHGLALGLLFVGILALGDRWSIRPRLPLWAQGLIYGGAVSGVAIALLATTDGGLPNPDLAGLVCLLHGTFGVLLGAIVTRLTPGRLSRPLDRARR